MKRMKSYLNQWTVALVVMIMGATGMQAQSTPDDPNYGYDLKEIAEEWKAYVQQPTAEKAYIGAFMEEFNVPKKNENGLSWLETYYWWASHHLNEVAEYVNRRAAHEPEE
jgi:hypothetical protein